MATPTSLRKAGVAITKRSASAQAAVAATASAVVTTAAATSSYGYTEAQANALVAQGNANRVDIAAVIVLLNELRTAMINAGLIKGS